MVETLNNYLTRSKLWRIEGQNSQLLLSYQTHKPVKSCSIARWIKEVLTLCGIDTSVFTAHSTRSASTSKAGVSGLSEMDILKRGSWSSKSTWQKHYKKEVNSDKKNANDFQEKLFE